MIGNFETCLDFVLKAEGLFSNDKNDPGGETKYGISKNAYPNLDIEKLTEEDAKKIYRKDYWERAECEILPSGIDLLVFDCAVNQGVNSSICILQKALRVESDGYFGEKTLYALQRCDVDNVCIDFMALRSLRYARNENVSKYGFGWFRRLFSLFTEIKK